MSEEIIKSISGNMVLGSTLLYRTRTIATITYHLTNCTSSNEAATIRANSSFTTTLIAATTFTYCGAQVLMGGRDITLDCYDIATGTLTIQHVTGNIVIYAEAIYGFDTASWFAIKNVAQNNFGETVGWAIGDLKPVLIGEYTYNVRIADMTQNRYAYASNPSKFTNMVFECVDLYVDSNQRHSSNVGNYAQNDIRNYYEQTIIPLMPQALQDLLEYITIPTYYLTGNSTGNAVLGDTNVKVFMPSETETGGSSYELGTVFEYYDLLEMTARQKKKVNGASYIQWWVRTGGYSYDTYSSSRFRAQVGVYINGDGNFSPITNSPSDAGTPSQAVTNSKGIPIVWAF